MDQRQKEKVQDILKTMQLGKWICAGHVAEVRWTTVVTEWSPCTGKRTQGRPYKKWRDEIYKNWGTRLPGHNTQVLEKPGQILLKPNSALQ